MYRRQVLGLGGALVTAGCAGVTTLGSGEPAEFDASLSAPGEVDLGEEFDVTVTVTNTGGTRGRYDGAITAFPAMRHEVSVPVEVGPVRPEQTVERSVGPLVAPYAGRWPFALENDSQPDDSQPIDVFPLSTPLGTSIQIAGGFEIRVGDVVRRDEFEYEYYDEGRFTRTAPEGRTFYFATVRVENVGVDTQAAPSRAEFSAVVGDGNYPIHLAREQWEGIDVPGDPYPGAATLEPRGSIAGWLPFGVPDEEFVGIEWNRDLRTSPPEAIWHRTGDNSEA